ncbi:hypothetical protein AGLY_012345 [Aphis glycines]|uniref:Uncharacterized protein n=1 Tax=Aphis glycines TaxID=307491 RepID=A0A6G0T9U1_APHGL|nr:hypothetical protein AGLY_012345 [Aphis glycines]
MESTSRNIGTTPGASEPQGSAVVGGSGVKAGSNVTGPLRSSSCDREGAGVASQAPATLATTSAETVVHERKTLADRLLESKAKPTQVVQHEDYKGKSDEELSEILEEKISAERDHVDRIGRRLNAMLAAVREAKSVAKPVQTLLADSIDVFKQAITARCRGTTCGCTSEQGNTSCGTRDLFDYGRECACGD